MIICQLLPEWNNSKRWRNFTAMRTQTAHFTTRRRPQQRRNIVDSKALLPIGIESAPMQQCLSKYAGTSGTKTLTSECAPTVCSGTVISCSVHKERWSQDQNRALRDQQIDVHNKNSITAENWTYCCVVHVTSYQRWHTLSLIRKTWNHSESKTT